MYILCRKLADGKMVIDGIKEWDDWQGSHILDAYDSSNVCLAYVQAKDMNIRLSEYDRQWPWYVQEIG